MCESSTWSAPPDAPSLQAGEVHVWRVELEQPEDVLGSFRSTLESDELQRAGRFHFEKDRKHFLVARGFLRAVLGRYLNAKAGALKFSYSGYGKPGLNGEHKNSSLRFNMSHSRGMALLALTEDKQIGVDVEFMRADFASEEIAQRFFSRCEVESFNALPKEDQVAAFFRCWTRKEAFIKATGLGLSQPLDEFDVTLAAGDPAALLRCKDDDASRWFLSDLEVGEDYAAALAVETPVANVQCWKFNKAR